MSKDDIKVIPLGGVCEIGKNMMLYEYDNKILIVDCGISFPDEEHPGVDLIICDWTYLRENRKRIVGLVLTHGHEDHVGAMGYFLREFPEVPVYGASLTLGIMAGRLRDHPVDPKTLNTHVVTPGDILKIGPFEVEFIRVGHSIPDACGLAIKTALGTIIQSGDFKFDQTPVDNRLPQFSRFAHYGDEGVLALLSDTTNAGRGGMAGSELSVRPGLERIFADVPGRILVATFASNVHRVQQIIDVAHLYGRRVACTGRSMLLITKIAEELGYLKLPQPFIPIEEIDDYGDHELCILMTGTQGEPMAALSKVARGAESFHRTARKRRGDSEFDADSWERERNFQSHQRTELEGRSRLSFASPQRSCFGSRQRRRFEDAAEPGTSEVPNSLSRRSAPRDCLCRFVRRTQLQARKHSVFANRRCIERIAGSL